ncbi:phage tail tube protein [Tianweitania sp. BSSL-BM11]|uniref:Phage tail tube protein n=1 Tax=Tianweitania aestuarii TaxID=2814886 RepID=A0ABS5RSZ4_9HYPH|nr:phage tail tube protein [Tianweitania aestuarii]MBS9720175.1 phage tail tube protein [Tianweitania aestuarii]
MAGRDFGGEMRLRLQDGRNMTMRGAFTLGTSGVSSESVTNQNGSVSRISTPRPRTAEITLEDDGTDHNALLRADRQDIYLTEDLTGVSHIFINAFISGDPRVNRANGETTGLMIEGDGYERRGG